MPNGEDVFKKQLAEWEKQAKTYWEQAQTSQGQLEFYSNQLQIANQPIERLKARLTQPFKAGLGPPPPFIGKVFGTVEDIKTRITDTETELERNEFYYRLYNELPITISGGQVTSVDEALAKLPPQLIANLSPTELEDVRNTITGMINIITRPTEPPEMAIEAEVPELAGLIPPTEVPPITLANINQLTVEEILKSLVGIGPPPPIMSDAEWRDLLKMEGYSDADLEQVNFMEAEADRITKEWEERSSQLEAFRTGMAELPDYELTDLLKEMVVQPGLALMELAGMYFEHVSQPLAGALYKTIIPDIEAEYQRLRKTESTWQALAHAWMEWDAPGEGAASWLLKYLLMEGLVDPLSYVGWGIATRVTRPLGAFGRGVKGFEAGIASVLELPFDAMKGVWKRLPRTLSQRAMVAQHQAGQYVEQWVTKYTNKHITRMGMAEFEKALNVAVKYAKRNPQSEALPARAGRELLKHSPVDEKVVGGWAERLGTTLRAEDITRTTVENIDNLFEDYFARRMITQKEASGRLMGILGVENPSDDIFKLAQRLFQDRASAIDRNALAFARTKSPRIAMQALMRRNFRLFIVAEESMAALVRKEVGRFSALLSGTSLRLQNIWRNGIDRWIVRPFAESYLAFGMYGPMNVLEDYGRSILGGVFPRRATVEDFERIAIGLSTDPELKRFGLSEMIGPLAREAPPENWNNPILQLFALGQKRWADKIYSALVRIPGAFGMDVRRNFITRRYLQILKEMGGDAFERLMKIDPRAPSLADRALIKQVRNYAQSLKTTGNPDVIRGGSEAFTRRNIIRNEVDNILKEHPGLPNSARDHVMKAYDDDVLFKEVDNIQSTIREANDIVMDDFIRGPEHATKQMDQLTDMLTQLEVRNPQEMAQALLSVNYMSQMQGALPRQVIAQATIRSRGLPLLERRARIDADMDRLYVFLDRAGADIDKVVGNLREQMAKPVSPRPKLANVRDYWDTRLEYNPLRQGTKETDAGAYLSYKVENAGDILREWHGNRDIGYIREKFNTIERGLGDRDWTDILSAGEIGRLSETKKLLYGLPEPDEASRVMKELISSIVDRDVGRIRVSLGELDGILRHPMVGVAFDPKYVTKADRLFDIMTTKREYATEFRTQNMATRSEIFAGATQKDLRTPQFWDNFYSQMDNEYKIFNLRMAEMDGMLTQAAEQMDMVAGIKPFTRPAIKVTDRALAPQDVAGLIGARGDDISRALMDVMTIQNDKDMFVAYIMAKVRPDDVGFTKESIGAVYDQIAYSMRVAPESMSWITAKQLELDAVRHDLHGLYNSKLLPENEVAEIGRYFDDMAGAVDDLMYGAVRPTRETVLSRVAAISGAEVEGMIAPELNRVQYTIAIRGKDIGTITLFDKPIGKALVVEEMVVPEGGLTREALVDTLGGLDDLARTQGLNFVDIVALPKHIRMYSRAGFEPLKTSKAYISAFEGMPTSVVRRKVPSKPPTVRVLKPEFKDYDTMRQSAMDEAHKWYYKEYTDYTNANAFDAMMKTIYPYWTYESQRWFWLPRSFVRHPGTFTAFERWQNYSDYGYIHVPGTSVDYNPFRGTIYGTLTTRLARRDFPEYYDALGIAGDVVEFNDFLSRYGFYPGAHVGIPLAMFGGLEQQMGEIMPAIWKTPLNALIAARPESESVKFISERIFSDRFRDYLTILMVSKRGYDGTLIWTKIKEGLDLTEDEQSIWDESRGEAALHGVAFEQFGMFRLRTDEQYRIYEESSKVIEEMTGYTPDQQDWLRKHGYRIWDMVGGMSPTQQAILQEMDYYRWIGNIRPLLPSRQQLVLNRLELDWDDVKRYSEDRLQDKLQLQRDFLSGAISPDAYNDGLIGVYTDQENYIDRKMEENPNMTLDGRTEYYKKFGIPLPVMHPMKELLNLYFEIELVDKIDEETGEKVKDWDTFWALREAIEDAIPDDLKEEWDDYISRNSTRMEQVRREVYRKYFRRYNLVWEGITKTYSGDERKLIEEFLYLERTGQNLARQADIMATIRPNGRKLISNFRSDVADARVALRYANPALDAWLFYWGRVRSFQTPQAEAIYQQISKETGRTIQ